MNRQDFKLLLKNYVEGRATEQEKILVDNWYELLYNDSIEPLDNNTLSLIEEDMWNKIEQKLKSSSPTSEIDKNLRKIFILKWAAAAAIFIALSFAAYQYFLAPPKALLYNQIKADKNLDETVNNSTSLLQVHLEDGSNIDLDPGAKIAFPKHFNNDKREVYLEGKAFFSIAKNPNKPFLVHSGNLITQVLGTSFTIAPDNSHQHISVSVKTGRVSVYEENLHQKKSTGAIITPNQKATYDASKHDFNLSLVENPEMVLPNGEINSDPLSFTFEDVSLYTVLQSMAKAYAIDILVENENIYQCKFTGDITNQSLYDKLALICQATNHTYEITGTKILIKGKGCDNP